LQIAAGENLSMRLLINVSGMVKTYQELVDKKTLKNIKATIASTPWPHGFFDSRMK